MAVAESLHEQVLFTIPEIAQILKISQITVRRQINSGALKAIRIGGAIRIHRDEIASYLERLGHGGD